MKRDVDRLYKLLPTIYRQRDAEQGWPLQALLRVIADQVNIVEADIAQLYENWFIETCQDWVVPYIGDLLGYQIMHEAGEPGNVTITTGQQRNRILIPRRDVANTIHNRRRKGTLKLLEELASDVASWPARAVEFYALLGGTQAINCLQPGRGQTLDLRNGDALERLDGPFDEVAHTIDVRRIISHRDLGRYNIPNVGLFVWRLKVYSVTSTSAFVVDDESPKFFTFSILGNDSQLYAKPQPRQAIQQMTDELNFPMPISRRNFNNRLNDYYGLDKSLYIWTGRAQPVEAPPATTSSNESQNSQEPQEGVIWEPVDPGRIIAADLRNWTYHPRGTDVAVDPVLGRIAFSRRQGPEREVRVLYHYGFSADMGGGEYNRPLSQPIEYQLFQVSKKKDGIHSIEKALEQWESWKKANPDQSQHHAVIEIIDSGVYTEKRLCTSLGEKESLQIRAANRKRPVIRLRGQYPDRTDSLEITGASNVTGMPTNSFILDGLLITGRGIRIEGTFAKVAIRHCTLVPGWEIDESCEPQQRNRPSLELVHAHANVEIEHSITGPIQVDEDITTEDPICIHISNSILDATSTKQVALGTPDLCIAYTKLTMRNNTVFGYIRAHSIELAENSIFTSTVKVARSQSGCVRFCYVPENSRTPRRYNCQPDLVKQAVKDLDKTSKEEENREIQQESDRVIPLFNSIRFGFSTYCQLANECAEEITRGANDESEMGVFHDLFQPQRAANLRARLDEYTPAGSEAGIIYTS